MPGLKSIWTHFHDEIEEKSEVTLDRSTVGDLAAQLRRVFGSESVKVSEPSIAPRELPDYGLKVDVPRVKLKRTKTKHRNIVIKAETILAMKGAKYIALTPSLRGYMVLENDIVLIRIAKEKPLREDREVRAVLRAKGSVGLKKKERVHGRDQLRRVILSGTVNNRAVTVTYNSDRVRIDIDVDDAFMKKAFFGNVHYSPIHTLVFSNMKLILTSAEHYYGVLKLDAGMNFVAKVAFGNNLTAALSPQPFFGILIGGAVAFGDAGATLELTQSTPFRLSFDNDATIIDNASVSLVSRLDGEVLKYEARLRGLWKAGDLAIPVTTELAPDTGVLAFNRGHGNAIQVNDIAALAPLLGGAAPPAIPNHRSLLQRLERYILTEVALGIDLPARRTTDVTLTLDGGEVGLNMFSKYVGMPSTRVMIQALHPHADARQVMSYAEGRMTFEKHTFWATFVTDGTVRAMGHCEEDDSDEIDMDVVKWEYLLAASFFEPFIEENYLRLEHYFAGYDRFFVELNPAKNTLTFTAGRVDDSRDEDWWRLVG